MKKLTAFILSAAMALTCSGITKRASAEGSNILVAYFSATGTTETVAKSIQSVLGSDIYEITPAMPYTSADLNYNSDCRANREQNDDSARPEISGSIENIEQYDAIFLGYPIWWGKAPKIIYTFLESYDLSGKTIIPFCTSGSSGIGTSVGEIKSLEPNASVNDGRRFSDSSESTVKEWTDGLSLPAPKPANTPAVKVEGEDITVSNAPNNSTLILAFYKNNVLVNVSITKGSGTITDSISNKAQGADKVKGFLWDMKEIRPLSDTIEINTENEKINSIYIHVNSSTFKAKLADNSSAEALAELLKNGDITVNMSDYGNFEKVGPLETSLPANDEQITTEAGDLILYQGNNIVIYYDTNSWNFTRLGKIEDSTKEELLNVLGSGDVTVTFSLN